MSVIQTILKYQENKGLNLRDDLTIKINGVVNYILIYVIIAISKYLEQANHYHLHYYRQW